MAEPRQRRLADELVGGSIDVCHFFILHNLEGLFQVRNHIINMLCTVGKTDDILVESHIRRSSSVRWLRVVEAE